MSDYISREAALASIRHEDPALDYAITRIPAADVRPVVRGRWISADDGETIIKLKYGEPQGSCFCSVCHEWLVASDEYDVKGNFCPNCGADMREES